MRRSIYGRSPQRINQPRYNRQQSSAQPVPLPPQQQNNIVYLNSTIQQYLNMRRITKDKGCLIIFLFYCLGLIIMLGIGFFFGNYNDLGQFYNDNAAVQSQGPCNATGTYLNQNMTVCINSCPSGFAFLGKVCLDTNSTSYSPSFSNEVSGLISMYNIKKTYPMIIYVSAGLLGVTSIIFLIIIYIPQTIYLLISTLFFMLLGMAFYLLKNFQLQTTNYQIIYPNSIFYIQQQYTRAISFFLLGIYLLIFPFVLFSPKKIQLGTFLISKIKQFYQAMSSMLFFSLFIVVVAWGSLLIQIFLVMNFYTAGTISKTPQLSMFHTYQTIYLNNTASLVFHFIGIYWVFATLISWHKYFISSAMCLWYFQDSQKLYPVKRGLKRSLHHLGTAALDAILLPIQWICLLIYSILKTNGISAEEEQNTFGCLQSIRQFFLSWYKYINRYSPSSAVLTNQNYMQSCKHSSQIFTLNSHRFFNIGGTLTIFLTLFVCVLWIIVMYFIVYFQVYNKQFPPVISSVVLPVFCVFIIGLVIGSLLANIFTSSLDCLLFCYLLQKKSIAEGQQVQRADSQLKIKKVLDQAYNKSAEQAKTSSFIYQQRNQNTMELSYIEKRE